MCFAAALFDRSPIHLCPQVIRMRTRPHTKFVNQIMARRCAKCGGKLGKFAKRCKRCAQVATRPKK